MERASDYFRHVQLLCCRVHLLSHIQIILRHRTLKICGYVENSAHIHRRITTVDNSQFACNRPDLTKITICKKVPSITGRDLSEHINATFQLLVDELLDCRDNGLQACLGVAEKHLRVVFEV